MDRPTPFERQSLAWAVLGAASLAGLQLAGREMFFSDVDYDFLEGAVTWGFPNLPRGEQWLAPKGLRQVFLGPLFWVFGLFGSGVWTAALATSGLFLIGQGIAVAWLARRLGLGEVAAMLAGVFVLCFPGAQENLFWPSVSNYAFVGAAQALLAAVVITEVRLRWPAMVGLAMLHLLALVALEPGVVILPALLLVGMALGPGRPMLRQPWFIGNLAASLAVGGFIAFTVFRAPADRISQTPLLSQLQTAAWPLAVAGGLLLIAGAIAAARRRLPEGFRWRQWLSVILVGLAGHVPFLFGIDQSSYYSQGLMMLPGLALGLAFDSLRQLLPDRLAVPVAVVLVGAMGLQLGRTLTAPTPFMADRMEHRRLLETVAESKSLSLIDNTRQEQVWTLRLGGQSMGAMMRAKELYDLGFRGKSFRLFCPGALEVAFEHAPIYPPPYPGYLVLQDGAEPVWTGRP